MNNDINIVIKSQSQPDQGEGYSAGQAVRGNAYGEEGLSANVRGDEQFRGLPTKPASLLGRTNLVRR